MQGNEESDALLQEKKIRASQYDVRQIGNAGQGDSTVKFEAPERFTTPCAEHSVEPQSHTVAKANGGS